MTVDGTIVVDTVAVVALSQSRGACYLLIAGAVVPIAGHAVHAWMTHHSSASVGVALTPRSSCCGPPQWRWSTASVRTSNRTRKPVQEVESSATPNDRLEPAGLDAAPRTRSLELIAEGKLPFREIARGVGVDDRKVRR